MTDSRVVSANNESRSGSRLGLTVAAAAIFVLVVGGLLMPVPFKGRLFEAIGDFAHAPLFGGVTLAVLALLQRIRPLSGIGSPLAIRSVLVFVAMFTFGVLVEWTQKSFNRDASMHDVAANGLGILAAISWYGSRILQRHHPDKTLLRRALLINCGFLLAIAWWRPAAMLRDVAAVHFGFPLLASFESPVELQRFYFRECEGRLTRNDATDGNHALEIVYQATPHPGATMIELKPDWSEMKTLELDVVLDAGAAENARFVVEVHDQLTQTGYDETFRREWTLEPGKPQHIRIERVELLEGPETRTLDLTKIRFVDLQVSEPAQPVTIRVDAIRLTVDE